jgi:hypothetical protein
MNTFELLPEQHQVIELMSVRLAMISMEGKDFTGWPDFERALCEKTNSLLTMTGTAFDRPLPIEAVNYYRRHISSTSDFETLMRRYQQSDPNACTVEEVA